MRKVKIEGYVVYRAAEAENGEGVIAKIDHSLFNEEFPVEWLLEVVSDEEIDWEDEE